MSSTIFYSWQADRPNSTNRNFIETCLKKAIRELAKDIKINEADRPDFQIDKDTKGVSGSPPIAETIFKKIDNCAAFVADLSFVGKRVDGIRPMPNVNVAVEYGYAVKAIGYERIITVMNTAYGEPRTADGKNFMPFDMQHLRGPITYHLPEETEGAEKAAVKQELVKILKSALKELPPATQPEPQTAAFAEQATGYASSTFLGRDEKLISQINYGGEQETYYLASRPHIFLRIFPATDAGRTFKASELKPLATAGSPLPFVQPQLGPGTNWGNNKYGFLIHNGGIVDGPITRAVQIFKSGEVWAINADAIREWKEDIIIPPFEPMLTGAMAQYRMFLQDKLEFEPPYNFVAGMAGIEDCRMYMPQPPAGRYWPEQIQGLCVEEEIVASGIIDADTSPLVALRPFFESVWEACSLPRPEWLDEE